MNTTGWKYYTIGDIFRLENCKCNNASRLLQKGTDISYIGAKREDNGFICKVQKDESLISKGNCIVFIGDGQGSVGYCTYQPNDFIGSSTLCAGYHPRLNTYIAIFLLTILNRERYRYSYGRKYRMAVVYKSKILLPKKSEECPDWNYMEQYIRDKISYLPNKAKQIWENRFILKSPNNFHFQDNIIKVKKWQWFKYKEIFNIKKGFYNKKPEACDTGSIPFIGATDSNNGITSMHTMEEIVSASKTGKDPNQKIEDKIFTGNCITVSNNGSIGYAFYQEHEFTCSHDVNPLYLKDHKLNKYIAMFLCTLIELERYRWAYGRKWRPKRMPMSMIKLPVDANGNPDWEFMENYIKALPYSVNI